MRFRGASTACLRRHAARGDDRRGRRNRALAGFLAGVALSLLTGCAGDDNTATVTVERTVTRDATTSAPTDTPRRLTLFFLREGKLEPLSRLVVRDGGVARVALRELLKGPQIVEQEAGLAPVSAIPRGTKVGGVSVAAGVADVELSRVIPREAEAQIVYTLTQFPTVARVRLLVEGEPQGAPRGRAAYEAQTPAILVLSPLPGDRVEPGFDVTGTANTFEATFQYELVDRSRRTVLSEGFVTATSGSGTRGTFEFTVPYEVAKPQDGFLRVFEISAANGSRTNEHEIYLQLE